MGEPTRVHELARERGIPAMELLGIAREIGFEVRERLSVLTPEQVSTLRSHLDSLGYKVVERKPKPMTEDPREDLIDEEEYLEEDEEEYDSEDDSFGQTEDEDEDEEDREREWGGNVIFTSDGVDEDDKEPGDYEAPEPDDWYGDDSR